MNKLSLFGNSKITIILRWFAFLPAAIVGLFVGGITANLFFWINSWLMGIPTDSGLAKIHYYVFSSVASSFFAVYLGTRVAPSGRKVVVLVLGGFMVVISTFGIIGNIMSEEQNLFWMVISFTSNVIAAGYVVYKVFTEGDDFFIG